MNVGCLMGHHDWKFSYNHGIPLGMNTEDTIKMFDEGKAFAVDACKRCKAQSSFIDGKRIRLSRSEVETP